MAHQIKFVGPAVVDRQLLAKDEKKKGVILPSDLRWNLDNRHTLIVKELHETAIEFFKNGPHADEFQIKEIDVPADFFDGSDVTANPADLEAAKAAAEEAEQKPETVNAETSGLDTTSTPAPRAGRR